MLTKKEILNNLIGKKLSISAKDRPLLTVKVFSGNPGSNYDLIEEIGEDIIKTRRMNSGLYHIVYYSLEAIKVIEESL